MGKDKLRRFRENETFSNVIQAGFEEVYGKDYPLKGQWAANVFGNTQPLVLELGCGKGEYTLALARRHKDLNYIGVDVKGARLWRGAKTALEEPLPNVAFLRTRIEFIDSFFAPGEVEQVWITFPDPQLLRENRRLTSPRFLERYLAFLPKGAYLHLKTDSLELHEYTKEVIQAHPRLRLEYAHTHIYSPQEALGTLPEEVTSVRTFYEQQYLAQGKPITYLRAQVI